MRHIKRKKEREREREREVQQPWRHVTVFNAAVFNRPITTWKSTYRGLDNEFVRGPKQRQHPRQSTPRSVRARSRGGEICT